MAGDFGRLVLAKLSPRGDVREACAKALVERGYTIRNDKGQFVKGEEFTKALSSSTDASGGYLVPDEFIASIISWANRYGVARQRLRKVPMGRERVSIPKRNGAFTVYYPEMGVAPTASDISFGLATLTAKKWAVLTFIDEELEEDAVIGVGEMVLSEMALAIAIAEDTNAFRGDGSAAYAGIVGVFGSANVAVVALPATKTSFADLTDDDLVDLKYAVPEWVRALPDCAYYASSSIVGVIEKMTDGVGRPLYQQPTETHPLRVHGHPAVPSQVLPDTGASAAGTKFLAFGSLMAWGALGQRRSIQMRRSTEVKFLEGQITLMIVPRQDIQETTGEAMATLKTATE
jgi:HK97 family phage major capsid protein